MKDYIEASKGAGRVAAISKTFAVSVAAISKPLQSATMSYLYSVYSFRPQHYAMESLLESPVKEIFSTIFFLIGFVGAVANVLLLYTFYKYFTYWRFTTRLWVNISLTLLLSSIALMFRAVGDHYERFSNTQLSCR
ncbi:hypothetical protein RRG08_011570 [Elysia crispata]|uniref:Uncharacterized protein n=1 Tax=Elysia crispata TaxID=231223 RepID=A0AAE0XTC7_9GAST|nr:hypothetical protein RRG08_011570 [Elysia crispata]